VESDTTQKQALGHSSTDDLHALLQAAVLMLAAVLTQSCE
jgi:hypothetical protein